MKKLLKICLPFLFFSHFAQAQEKSVAPDAYSQLNEIKMELPASWQDLTFSDFLGVSESFNIEKPQLEKTVGEYGDFQSVERTFDDLQKLLNEYRGEWKSRLKLSNWDLNSVMKFKMAMSSVFEISKQEKQGYFDFVNKTDELISNLKAKKIIFENFYRKAQQDPALLTQTSTMKAYVDDIDNLLMQIQKQQLQYAKVYKDKSKIIESMEGFGKQIDDEINGFKEMRFQKTVPAFYEDEFRSFFNESMWQSLLLSWQRLTLYSFENLKANVLTYFQMIVLTLFFGFLLRVPKRSDGKRQAFTKPFFLSFVIVLIGFRAFSDTYTILGESCFWIALLILIQLLMGTLVRQDVDRRGMRLLVFVYGFLQIVNSVGIPHVLYRMILVLLPLVLIIYGYSEIKNNRIATRKFLSWMLQALVVLSLSASVAELMGYHLLAVLLFQGALQSVFAIFLAWQVRYVVFKLLFSTFTAMANKGVVFFEVYKIILLRKVRFIVDVAGVLMMSGLLLSIWGFTASWWHGVLMLWDLGVTFQNFNVTLGRILQSYFILYATHFISSLLISYLDDVFYPRKGVPLGSAKAINALINYLAWVIGLFGAFSALGFALEQFALIAGALSVGIGFGLQNIVNNFVSGLILLFERPIKVGDLVNLNGDMGTIEKVGLRSTVIRTASKTQMIVPNSDLITQRVENMTLSDKDFRILIPVGVAYGTDPHLVKDVLLKIADSFEDILKEPEPQALFVSFGESAMNFELLAWIHDVTTRRDLVSEINFKIESEFRKAKIDIPFPQREIHIKNGFAKNEV